MRVPSAMAAAVTTMCLVLAGTTATGASAAPSADRLSTTVPRSLAPTVGEDARSHFWDVSAAHPFGEEVRWLVEARVTQGYPDGSFRPQSGVTRQAMAAFLYRFAGSPAFTPPRSSPFADVRTDHPFYAEIAWLAREGISTGSSTSGGLLFKPGDAVTRQAMAAFLHRYVGSPATASTAAPRFSDVSFGDPFHGEIGWLAAVGVSTGTRTASGTYFKPTQAVSREAMAAFLYRMTEVMALTTTPTPVAMPAPTPNPVAAPAPVPGPGSTPASASLDADDFIYLRGINVAGGEFEHTPAGLPGKIGVNYNFDTAQTFALMYAEGHRIVRLPFRWERVQHQLGGPLSEPGIGELKAAVTRASDAGLLVLLDLHNYGRYIRTDDVGVTLGDGITDAQFADVWSRLVEAFADQPAVVGWGLMNEPNDLPKLGPGATTTVWKRASQAAVDAIRATGDERTVFVAGDRWGGARQWEQKNGRPWITDPADDVVYEAHYYADPDNAGAYPQSYAQVEADAKRRGYASLEVRVVDEVDDFTAWLDKYGVRGFIGEVGWPHTTDAAQWNVIGERIYDVLDEAEVGVTYWATGQRWNKAYRLNPYRFAPFAENPQAQVIESHPSVVE